MIPKAGEVWVHYKHDTAVANSYTYKIIGIGLITDNSGERKVVIYQPLYPMPAAEADQGIEMFVRGIDEFMEEVEVNGQKKPRFQRLA
jgi:hypothetical protein